MLAQFPPTREALSRADFDPHRLYTDWFMSRPPAEIVQANPDSDTLYQRILRESCELIVDCSQALPQWTTDNLLKQLEQPDSLFAPLRTELQHWQQGTAAGLDEMTRIEQQYRRAMVRRFARLQIFGLSFDCGFGKSAHQYCQSVAYIPLTLQTDFDEHKNPETWSAEAALSRFERQVILGEAGQGKTTLLQWLAVQCACKGFSGDSQEWNEKVPLLFKLREIHSHKNLPLAADFYPLMVKNIDPEQIHRDWLSDILANKKAILMIDGYDEVPVSRRGEVLKWIDNLCRHYVGNQIILTSRPAAYDESILAEQHFQLLRLQTMNHSARQDFIAHWHQAIALEYDRTRPQQFRQQGERLLQRFEQQRSLRKLAGNPLLCGVICLLHHDNEDCLPDNRSGLYEVGSRLLLDSRNPPDNGRQADEFNRLNYRDKQSLLAGVAQWLNKNEQTSLSPQELVEFFVFKLYDLPDLKKHLSAEQLKSFFLERDSFLIQVGATEIQFAHRSFQEYFTAKYLIDEEDWTTLRQNASNNYCYETLQLAMALCHSKADNETFLTGLLQQADQFESQANAHATRMLYQLVLRCRAGMEEISASFADQLSTIIPKIMPPQSPGMVDALVAADALALPFLQRPETQSPRADFYCIQVLLQIAGRDAYVLLKDYLKPRQSAAIAQRCAMIEKMDRQTAKTANLGQLMLDDGLENFPDEISCKMAFLLQDPQLMPTAPTTRLTRDDIDPWALSQGLAPFGGLPQLHTLDLRNTSITRLDSVARLVRLQTLYLSHTLVEDLRPLAGLGQLQTLDLRHTPITDLTGLADLSQLQTLNLSATKIHDLTPLAGLTQLLLIDLYDTDISAEAIALMQQQLPRCRILK